MNKQFKLSFLLLIILVSALTFISCSTSSSVEDKINPTPQIEPNYYFKEDFESYNDGDSLSGFKPFDNAGRTIATSEKSYSGNKSAKMIIKPEDKGGFGVWGGTLYITPAVKKGGEVWVRIRIYWPSSFQFTSTPRMKFMRLHNKSLTNNNAGYNDLYIDPDNVFGLIKEVHNKWEFYNGEKIPRDRWETYEMYLFVDDKSVDQGGKARIRVWRDGNLIFNRTDVPTITEEGGVIDFFHLFTYWNNENPPSNYCYVDDIIIATDNTPPINKDSNGNIFIGK